jgi:hypothetical protein
VRKDGAAPRRWANRVGVLSAIAILVWLSFRTDALFHDSSPHHWSFWIGPIESVRSGGWLLWDVPSQYGFLSILLPAILPISSAWESLYVVQAILLSITSTLLFLQFRQSTRGAAAFVAPLLLTLVAVHFMSGFVETLSGPQPWLSVGAMRFFWCHAALSLTWLCLGQGRPRVTAFIWIGGVLWTIGVMWSFESAVYTTSVLGAANAILAIQAGSRAFRGERHVRRAFQAMAPYAAIPFGFLATAVGCVALYYRTFLGLGPDWWAFCEFASQYSQGFGAESIDFDGPVWALLAVLLATTGLAAAVLKRNPFDPRLAMVLGAWGAVWSTASYFVGRSHPNNISNLMPILFMVAAILLPVARRFDASHVFRHSLMPLFLASLMTVFAHPKIADPVLSPHTSWRNVASRLPVVDTPFRNLVERNHVSLDDPISCNFLQLSLPLPLEAHPQQSSVAINSESWLPKPVIMLVVLPPERRAIYVKRQVERRRQDGWLIEYLRASSPLDEWLRDEISHTHKVVLVDSVDGWALFRCDCLGSHEPAQVASGSPFAAETLGASSQR